MKIGIIGKGIVGGALSNHLLKKGFQVAIRDIPKGIEDDMSEVSCVFICLPANTLDSRKQDISAIKEYLFQFRALECPIFIRSTVLPGTCDDLAQLFNMKIYAFPEFLTENKAEYDLSTQDLIAGVIEDHDAETILSQVFKGKTLYTVSNIEAEMAKYVHNGFAAVKVNYFNIIKRACERLGVNYRSSLLGGNITGFIEKSHTQVPGPDLKYGFGGGCLPKDLKAFIGLLQGLDGVPVNSLKLVETENKFFRETGTLAIVEKPTS